MQRRAVIAERAARRDRVGVGRGRLDPGLEGAVRARQRAAVEAREALVGVGARAARPRFGRELEPRGDDLVEARLAQDLVDLRVELAAEVALERAVEDGADAAGRVALLERGEQAAAVHVAGGLGPHRAGVGAEHLVGRAGTSPRGEGAGERLGRRRIARRGLERAEPILEGGLLVLGGLAPRRRDQVRGGGVGGRDLRGRPRRERAEQLARDRLALVERRRVLERVGRAGRVVRSRQEHRDPDQRRRRLRPPLHAEPAQRGRREGRLAQAGEPAGELRPKRGILADRQGAARQRGGHVEIRPARGHEARQRDGGLALALDVALGAVLGDARSERGLLGPRPGVARDRRRLADALEHELSDRGGRGAIEELRRRHGPPRLRHAGRRPWGVRVVVGGLEAHRLG